MGLLYRTGQRLIVVDNCKVYQIVSSPIFVVSYPTIPYMCTVNKNI